MIYDHLCLYSLNLNMFSIHCNHVFIAINESLNISSVTMAPVCIYIYIYIYIYIVYCSFTKGYRLSGGSRILWNPGENGNQEMLNQEIRIL